MKGIGKYWGYLVLLLLITAWWTSAVGPLALVVLSVLVMVFFLFRAPVFCCAVNRDGSLCRNNSRGLLLGCSYRQHKLQKLKMTVVPHQWRALNRGLWVSPKEGLATLVSVGGLVSTVTSLVMLAVKS
jgi:hypothetical protein